MEARLRPSSSCSTLLKVGCAMAARGQEIHLIRQTRRSLKDVEQAFAIALNSTTGGYFDESHALIAGDFMTITRKYLSNSTFVIVILELLFGAVFWIMLLGILMLFMRRTETCAIAFSSNSSGLTTIRVDGTVSRDVANVINTTLMQLQAWQ